MARPPRLREVVPLGTGWRTALLLIVLAMVAVSELASAEGMDPDCYTLRPLHDRHQGSEVLPLTLEDKLALSPIVVQARLISRLMLSLCSALYDVRVYVQNLSYWAISILIVPQSGPRPTMGCTSPPCGSSR